jgi:hypothetical protein
LGTSELDLDSLPAAAVKIFTPGVIRLLKHLCSSPPAVSLHQTESSMCKVSNFYNVENVYIYRAGEEFYGNTYSNTR